MKDIAIRVEHLSKQYRIGKPESYKTLRDSLTTAIRIPFHTFTNIMNGHRSAFNKDSNGTIWALKDVSFEVKRGEVIGIIGRNGAGKSTLLKILSQITEPTEGRVEIHGRVGSLLEVGTGFHPELSGRENIYLYAAILGMKKFEIARKFDQIVSFAEIEKFIDTPVKHYSSGMYMRLAFAVAAHLEPEILLVDEVLAVGDVVFQKKCLDKMGDVAKDGLTVLFVSHNMAAISTLCPSTISLNEGKMLAHGPTLQVVAQYLSSGNEKAPEAIWSFEEAPSTHVAKLRSVSALNDKNKACFNMQMNEPIILKVEFWMLRKSRLVVGLHLFNQQGLLLFATGNSHDPNWTGTEHEPGLYVCSWTIPKHLLSEGQHYVTVGLKKDSLTLINIPEVISFNVVDPGDTRGNSIGFWPGLVRPILPWRGERIGDLPY